MLRWLLLAFLMLVWLFDRGPSETYEVGPRYHRPPTGTSLVVLRLDPPRGNPRTAPIFVCNLAESLWVMQHVAGAQGGEVHSVVKSDLAEIDALFDAAAHDDPWVTDKLPPDFGPPQVWTIRAFDRAPDGTVVARTVRRASAEAIAREGDRTTDNIGPGEHRRMGGAMYAILMMTEIGTRNDCATPAGWPPDAGERRRLLLADGDVANARPAGRRFLLDVWFHRPNQRASDWSMSLTDDPRWPRENRDHALVSVAEMRSLFARALVPPEKFTVAGQAPPAFPTGGNWGELRVLVHVPNSDNPRTVYDVQLTTAQTRVLARALADALGPTHPALAMQLLTTARTFPDFDDPRERWGD